MAEPVGPESLRQGHEVSDVSPRALLITVAGFVAVLAVLCLLPWAWFAILGEPVRPAAPQAGSATSIALAPGAPRLQSDPWADLRRFRERERAVLDGYGWVDRQRGIARIPIGEAMGVLARQGWPVQPNPPPGAAVPRAPDSPTEPGPDGSGAP